MSFRKSILGLAACAALAGLFAWSSTIQARPFPPGQDADIRISLPGKSKVNLQTGPICETTGFEPVEGACITDTGFICGGGFVGVCFPNPPQVCTGDNSTDQNCCNLNRSPSGWYMSISSQHCNEPHIDTANPATGSQHLRFDQDLTGGNPPGCTGFGGACRISAFTPDEVGPLPIGRTIVDFDVAFGDPSPQPPSGSAGVFWTVADNEPGSSGLAIIVTLDALGAIFVDDIEADAVVGVGLLTGNGAYDHFNIDIDPCNNTVTYTMTDAAGGFIGSHSHGFVGLEKTMERGIFLNDNAGFFWDFDNYAVVREGACPSQCGDDVVQGFLGEQCDGTDDALCPGRCTPKDSTAGGPATDTECRCIVPCEFCSNDPTCVADNGTNGPFLTHGGFFTYTPDGPFTSIDTCGSDFDTTLFVGADFCTGGASIVNDECFDFAGDCTDGNHGPENCAPFASCYNDNPNFESCLCVDTVAGTPLQIWAAAFPGATPPAGSNLLLTITKALSCGPDGSAIPNGACCNGVDGTCADNVLAADCAGPSDTYSDNKLCSFVDCAQDTGGCCDRSPGLGGQCTGGILPQDCAGALQVFSKLDDTCGGTCTETEGACCDGLTGNCFESIQGDCPESTQTTWALGALCSEISCVAATGACCDTGTNDPTVSICTPTTLAGCNCTKCSWSKGAACADVTCLPNFQTIPTVSEWGLVVLTLLLLVGGKIYFGRREAALA